MTPASPASPATPPPVSTHPRRYSFVVDWLPAHAYQAEVLIFTLREYAGAPPGSIVAHCTRRVDGAVREALQAQGCAVVGIAPYLDGAYCNKIAQLDHFAAAPEGGSVFLLDLDLAILAPLDIPDPNRIWGKVVDGANPPLATIERLFAAAGVALPDVVPCDWQDRGETAATNLNGGFLHIPAGLLRPLRAAWRHWAEFLFDRQHLFEPPAARKHIDQMAFALALASEDMPFGHLPANWNFPLHQPRPVRSLREGEPLRVLHYHDCLDAFGLLAPRSVECAAVERAVRRVNAALGARPATAAFEQHRRHLALDAASRIPAPGRTAFPPQFIARTRIGGARRRLILHAGTPKTGTTSLQRHLAAHRQTLADAGWWYPPTADADDPRHLELAALLRRGAAERFADYAQDVLRDMPEHIHTVILSTEGIYNHWRDFGPEAKGMLRHWAALFDFELCVWLRPPEAFAAALHVQYLANPPTPGAPEALYGRDISFADALANPWFRSHLDYLGFLHEARLLFGERRVRAFAFAADTVAAFCARYGLPDLPRGARRNASLGATAAAMLRLVNRHPLEARARAQAVAKVREIDALLGAAGAHGRRFAPTAAERRLVRRYAQRGWERAQPLLDAPGAAQRRALRKVFCIGFHKTGTKSLAAALRRLGYRATGPNGARMPNIGAGDTALALALSLAPDYDAFSDNPWPLLYRQLDAAFPDSRFILTVRPEARWIASVRRHFGSEETPMRAWIYGHGAPAGHEDVYTQRYRRHNADALRYFAGRADFLVMDLEAGDGWAKLCAFLGANAPEAPFPHCNRAGGGSGDEGTRI